MRKFILNKDEGCFKKIFLLPIFLAALGLGFFSAANKTSAETYHYPNLPVPAVGDTYTVNFSRNMAAVVPANLDGDEVLDWVGRSPTEPGGTVILEARKTDGTLLWQYDTKITADLMHDAHLVNNKLTGYSEHEAHIAWDLDGNGKDEVFTIFWDNYAKVPYVVALNGETGEERSHIIIPYGEGFVGGTYNHKYKMMGQHYVTIAYLDGPRSAPSVIFSYGVYVDGVVWAFDWDTEANSLKHRWTYQHRGSGTSAHTLNAYDLDGDGLEEIIYGGTVLRTDGSKLFSIYDSRSYGHVNSANPGNLDPDNPGNEIFYAVEQPYEKNRAAALMVNWKGDVLWEKIGTQYAVGFTANVNNNINARGDESYTRQEPDASSTLNEPDIELLIAANGDILEEYDLGVDPSSSKFHHSWTRPPEWDGDDLYDWRGIGGGYGSYPCDVGGGENHGAEEIINLNPSIYNSGTNPALGWITIKFNKTTAKSYPSRWANRHYRQDCARAGSGYAPGRDTWRVVKESVNDNIAPSQPQNLKAVSKSPVGIDLAWNASADDIGVGGYRIFGCEGNGCAPAFIGYAYEAKTSYSHNGLRPDTSYTYAVAAYDASGKLSSLSNQYSLRTPPKTDTNLVAHWAMDSRDTPLPKLYDQSGNDLHAEVAKSKLVPGKIREGLEFNYGAYAKVADNQSLNFSNQDFSVSFWISQNNWPPWNNLILQKGNNSSSIAGFDIRRGCSNDNEIGFVVKNSSGQSACVGVDVSGKINDGKWHHVAAVRDSVNKKITLYFDGSLKKTMATTTVPDVSSDKPLLIGAGRDDTNAIRSYAGGAIDDVRIYNKALDDSAVETLYNGFSLADINNDNKVNIKDIQSCIKAIVAPDSFTTPDQINQLAKCEAVASPEAIANIKDIQGIIREIIK